MKFDHPTLPPEELEALADLFTRCAEAALANTMMNDQSRRHQAAILAPLDEVAAILGLTGPSELADDLADAG